MGGSETLSEAAKMLRDFADHLEELERKGWKLTDTVNDGYGEIEKRSGGKGGKPIRPARNKARACAGKADVAAADIGQ